MAGSIRSSEEPKVSPQLKQRRGPKRKGKDCTEPARKRNGGNNTATEKPLNSSGFFGHCSPSRVLVYFVLAFTLLLNIALIDLLNGGPYGELITPLVDYALPLMNDPDYGKSAVRDICIMKMIILSKYLNKWINNISEHSPSICPPIVVSSVEDNHSLNVCWMLSPRHRHFV